MKQKLKKYQYITDWNLGVINYFTPKDEQWFGYEIDILGFGKKLIRDKFENTQVYGAIPLSDCHDLDKSLRNSYVGALISIHNSDQNEAEQFSLTETNSLFRKLEVCLPKADFGNRNIIGHMSFNSDKSNPYYSTNYIPILDFTIFMSFSESRIFKGMIRDSLRCNDQTNKLHFETAFLEKPDPSTIVNKSIDNWIILITGIWYNSYCCIDKNNLIYHPAYKGI